MHGIKYEYIYIYIYTHRERDHSSTEKAETRVPLCRWSRPCNTFAPSLGRSHRSAADLQGGAWRVAARPVSNSRGTRCEDNIQHVVAKPLVDEAQNLFVV